MKLAANGTLSTGMQEEGAGVKGVSELGTEREESTVDDTTSSSINKVAYSSNDRSLTVKIGSNGFPVPSETSYLTNFGDHSYVTWWSDSKTVKKNNEHEVLFAKSTDRGATYSEAINLSNSPDSIDYDSRIIASNNHIYTTWTENTIDPLLSDSIWLRASSDYGSTFGPAIRINNDSPLHTSDVTTEFGIVKATDDHSTHMAAAGDDVYVAWYCHEIKDNWEVYLRASNDGGKTFEETINISNSPGTSYLPEIATDSYGNVYLSYWEDTLNDKKQFMTLSTD